MLIIFLSVVPKFVHLLESGRDLPVLAAFVLNLGKFAYDFPWILFGLAITLLIVIILLVSPVKSVQRAILNLAIELPIVGPWLAEQDTANWASLCAAMLSARVNLLTTLNLAAESCDYKQPSSQSETND